MHRGKRVFSKDKMENVEKMNEMDKLNIEKRPDMHVHTVAGKYHVEM